MPSKTSRPRGFAPLREALLAKVNKKKQWLSYHVNALTSTMPMETKIAQAVVAHQHGVRLNKFLTGDDLTRVQQMIGKLPTSRGPVDSPNGSSGGSGKAGPRAITERTFKVPKEATRSDGVTPGATYSEAVLMASTYPLLYVLENSIRTIIKGVMEAAYGADWWDKKLTAGKVLQMKQKVDGRLKNEDENSWHPRRGAHKIDYIDLTDLQLIAASKPDLFFPKLLGKRSWFEGLIDEVAPSRNVLCHMNALKTESVTALKVRVNQWQNHVLNRRADLTAAMTAPTDSPAP